MRFDDIVTLKSLFKAWKNFSTGKRNKIDVQFFEAHLEDELLVLLENLLSGNYTHSPYRRFIVHDPKRRIIHKATVRDRIVHRLIYNTLLPIFHRRWLDCSFSCRPGFGQRRSIEAERKALRQATRNWSKECWMLKCDVRKFFDSVNHEMLLSYLNRCVQDQQLRSLLVCVVGSYSLTPGSGLPIGNLTSQLFANVYLHELDWYVKQTLKHRWYVRYADDFLFLCQTREEANAILKQVQGFLALQLKLNLNPNKILLRKSTWGIDWLGHVLLPSHEVLRPSTRQRMMRKIEEKVLMGDGCAVHASLVSYHGLLQGTARRTINNVLLQSLALMR